MTVMQLFKRIFLIHLLAFSLMLSAPLAWAESEFVIVEPGTFHGDEAPARGQKGWLALIEKDGDWRLEETSIQVRLVRDVVLDEDGGLPTGREISCRQHPEARVLLNHPSLKAGKVKLPDGGRQPLPKKELDEKHSESRLLRSFKFNGQVYWLELFPNIHGLDLKTSDSDSYDLVDRLFLHSSEPKKPAISTPLPTVEIAWAGSSGAALHSIMETHSTVRDIWVGDLDNDGLPDLIVWNGGYNHSGVCLYLSSLGAPDVKGALPGRAGCQIGVGC